MSAGLADALRVAGSRPRIVPSAHPAARIAAAWRGSIPILTRGDRIFWPGAPADVSAGDHPAAMATLQHELQHVLDYRAGRLTAARYLLDPREWFYGVDPGVARFERLGAEQRATLVERLWLAENGRLQASEIETLRAAIPWASQPRQAPSLDV